MLTALFDLDGTLLDISGIRDWSEGRRTDFEEFHKLAIDAPHIPWVLDALKDLWDFGYNIVIGTARSLRYHDVTHAWLSKHNIPYHRVMMRSNSDLGTDVAVKSRMLFELDAKANRLPALAFEDNPSIVKLWQEYEIPTVVVPGWGTA